jgi:hypothetical protein
MTGLVHLVTKRYDLVLAGLLVIALVLVLPVAAAPPVYSYIGPDISTRGGGTSLLYPYWVGTGPSNSIYIADTYDNRVPVYTSAGAWVADIGPTGSFTGSLNIPYQVSVNSTGYIHILDFNNQRILIFTPARVFVRQIGPGGFVNIPAFAFDSADNIWVLENSARKVMKFSPSGASLSEFTITELSTSGPQGIAINSSGYFYVADMNDNKVGIYDPTGAFVRLFGSSGSGNGQFNQAVCVAVDAGDNVYVTDLMNNRIQIFTPDGSYLTAVSSGSIPFYWPGGVSFDSTGRMLVADTYNNLIARFDPSPVVSAVSPASGSPSGGNSVVITGTGFYGATSVKFGSAGASGYTVNSPGKITATAPAGTGTVDVTVTTSKGTSALSAADQYTYTGIPTVTSISPTSGPVAGGTSVSITGTNFIVGATSVNFGSTAATTVTVNSGTSITATSPAGVGTVHVTATTTGGTSSTVASDQFTYAAAPTVTDISPENGPTAGSTSVTITGTGFVDGATVTFGGTAGTGVAFVSSTSITATTPAHAAGEVDVVVTNPDTQSGTLSDEFTYIAPPTVTGISPPSGPTAGSTSVTITGTGFVDGATVTFGGTAGTGVAFVSSTTITATTPAHTAGAVDVVVTNPDTQAGTLSGGFTYIGPPTVSAILPTGGTPAGGTPVTITGTGFVDGATVTFGGTAGTSVAFVSSTTITATTPAHVAGAVDVVVTNPDTQYGTLTSGFMYAAPPTVTDIAPVSGPSAGSTSVTITGTGFVDGATVTFGGAAGTSVAFVSSTTITATTPAHAAGAVDVVVTNPDTQYGTLTSGFMYTAPPTVTDIAPVSGPSAGSTPVTITGTGFIDGATVTFGGTAGTSVAFVSSTTITAMTPAHAAGAVDVVVTNPDTQYGTLVNGFTYIGPPTVTDISPNGGTPAGGTLVTITGTGFVDGATVTFGGTAGTGVAFVSSTTITATTPAHAAGAVDVVVTNPDTQSGTLANGFQYTDGPVVTSILPVSGTPAGGTLVTITGTGFIDGATVTFGGAAGTGVAFVSSTTITATTPAHVAGAVDVVVTNPDTQTGTLTNGYTYTVVPVTTVPTTAPTTAPYVPAQDTSGNNDDFPSATVSPSATALAPLPLMTVTVNIGGDSKAWQAIVTGTKLSELIVTGTVQPGSGSNMTAPPGIVFQYISLVPARYDSITKAVINFTVPQSWLDENHIAPGSIVLYHQTANGWEALPTTVLYTKDGTVYLTAQSNGFSLFAIAGAPTVATPPVAAPTTEIVSTPVQEQTPAPASSVKAPVTTQTTAPPAASPQPSAPSPLLNIVLVIAAIGLLAGGGFMVRRWWIRRQNPALFEEC